MEHKYFGFKFWIHQTEDGTFSLTLNNQTEMGFECEDHAYEHATNVIDAILDSL